MLTTKRVTDTLQTLFFLNNNIPRFLLNERACFKKNLLIFFFSEENKHCSFFPDQNIWGRVFLANWATAPSTEPQRSSPSQSHLAECHRYPLHPGLPP